MESIICIFIGIIIGVAIGLFYQKSKKVAVETELSSVKKDNDRLSRDCQAQKTDIESLLNEKQALSSKCAVLDSQLAQERKAFSEKMEETINIRQQEKTQMERSYEKLLESERELSRSKMLEQDKRHQEAILSMKESFDKTIEHLKANLKATTEDLLKNRQEEFTDMNRKNMQVIVDPLNETIKKMRDAMDDYSKQQSEFSGSMKSNIETIIKQTETARESAVELTTALKHNSKVQGDYGEAILDEILSKQGFTEGVHYELQYVMKDDNDKALKDEDGIGLRPDVVFHIDKVRDVIIDSKMNLTDFINFANAEDPDERKMYLDRHVKSIENQVKLLSQKKYYQHHKKTSGRMDYVIMFVPISAAWWEALRYKPSLWREAMDNNVYIADEQTLFAALRIIKLTWTQIAQVDSQKEIFELVNEMIDRVGQFMKSYQAIGTALEGAQKAYAKGMEKLTPGGQSILKTTEKLLKKGGQDSKKNPVARFVDIDDVEQLPEPVLPIIETAEGMQDSGSDTEE